MLWKCICERGSKLTSQGNWKNMEQLVYHSFTQNICWSKIKNNTTVMCFVIYFQIGVLGTFRGHLFRTLLGRPWHVSPHIMRKWINLIVCTSWWCAELTSIREIFGRTTGRSSKMLQIQRTVALLIFVLIKTENRDVEIHTYLNVFEGETSVTEKVVLKKKVTIFEYWRNRDISIYLLPTFSQVAET